jgi:hypothetical protein
MATSDDLWGGQLVGVDFDPVDHTCDLHVTTVLDGTSRPYVVVCRGVAELRFHNAIPEPWTYAEVTEAHVSIDERSGQHLLELILWSEDAHLIVKCSQIEIRESDL